MEQYEIVLGTNSTVTPAWRSRSAVIIINQLVPPCDLASRVRRVITATLQVLLMPRSIPHRWQLPPYGRVGNFLILIEALQLL